MIAPYVVARADPLQAAALRSCPQRRTGRVRMRARRARWTLGSVVSAAARAAASLDVDELDRTIEAAIRAGEAGALRVLGYGELTLVVGWPTERPQLAVKRLPVFERGERLERYEALLLRYVDELRARGVDVVPTELRAVARGGEWHAYIVQPLVPRAAVLNRVLAEADPQRGARLLGALAASVSTVVDARVGLDAQVANWAVDGDRLACLDISTPLMRDAVGRDELDVGLFLSIYPWLLRGVLRRIARSVMAQYHDPRAVLVDVASNLVKERLEQWLPALLAAAGARVAPPIDEAEVRRYFSRDRLLWLTMQRLRRADRAWQRHVRRRPYPFLLPPPYGYGPPELPEEEP